MSGVDNWECLVTSEVADWDDGVGKGEWAATTIPMVTAVFVLNVRLRMVWAALMWYNRNLFHPKK